MKNLARKVARRKILKQSLLPVDGKPYEELMNCVRKNDWR